MYSEEARNEQDWEVVSRLVYKPVSECIERYRQLKKAAAAPSNKGGNAASDKIRKWTPQEDQMLRELVIQNETYKWRGSWSKIAAHFEGRSPNQCR